MKYLAEIIIDGYTDTDGDYSYNLQLSQQRSLAVAQYLLDIQGDFLDSTQSANLQNYLTVNGHSMANPVRKWSWFSQSGSGFRWECR